MMPLVIFKKLLLFFAPFVILYFLRKIGKKNIKKKSHLSDINKSQIVEGEVVEKRK